MIKSGVEWVGAKVLDLAEVLGEVTDLFQKTLYWFMHTALDFRSISAQMLEIGIRSFPVTALTSLFTGMVLALQSGYSFRNIFNEPVYVGTVVGFSMAKELGPVMTALVVAGRVGAAIAAELGTMKVTEQIDALYTLGTNPVKYLVVPRFIACFIMIPILTVFSVFIGVWGGYFVSVYRLSVASTVYWDDIFNTMDQADFFHGFIKSFFFAVIIVVVSCYKGFQTSGGAEGVGKSTTSAVVISMVLILVTDYFLSAILVALGIG